MMSTLKRQYKIYIKQNPNSNLSYEEWEKNFLENLKLGMELGDDFSDWDVTLMDGMEDE
jgi:hypothetical protein